MYSQIDLNAIYKPLYIFSLLVDIVTNLGLKF
jgi:hypothetical protein